MSLSTHRTALALLTSVALIAAALLATSPDAGAATIYACKSRDGTIRLVGKKTRCRRGQKKLKWGTRGPAGRNGSNGSNGANGQNGARGPAGAFNVLDQAGTNVGLFAGFTLSGTAIYTPSGVILIYDNQIATVGPSGYLSTFIYRAAGCVGTPYVLPGGFLPFDAPAIMASPAAPGSQMYTPIVGTQESFTYQSLRTPSGCTNTSGPVTNVYQIRENGIVPIVQEPLRLQPIS